MTEKRQTGEPLISGTIKAEDQQAELHRPAEPSNRLTPLQAARVARDEYPGEGPEGFTEVKVAAEDVAVLFGVRPPRRRTNASEPDGAWDRIDGAKAKKPTGTADAAEAAREAQRLRDDFKQHTAKVVRDGLAAKESGSVDRIRAAQASVAATASLGKRLKEKLGRL